MKKMTENDYLKIVKTFKEIEYKDFENKVNKHRNPDQFAQRYLQELSERMVSFQSKNQMNQILPLLEKIFEADKTLTFFQAIQLYCKQENKNSKNTITLLAKYKGMEEAYRKIRHENPIAFEENEKENKSSTNKEFTTPRQVLAMHFIFEYMQIRNHEIDKTAKSRFIEFLTGKHHQNIYTLVLNPFATKTKEFRYEDLKFVKKYFEKLGLDEIVKMINDHLEKPK